MKMKEIRIFADMDGTMCRFYEKSDCLERMYASGFFKNLNSYENVVEGLKLLMESGIRVYILSAVDPKTRKIAEEEKKIWIRRYFPNLLFEFFIFVEMGTNKAEKICSITKSDILIDDYNKNLLEWRKAGGTSVKLVNEINDKGNFGPLWNGERIRYDFSPERIFEEIKRIISA